MPEKRKEEGVYSIMELSPEVRERVLDRWRTGGHAWGDHDSDFLNETFREILSERGFSNPDTCWSLSSSQGDGVAFSGNLDLSGFFKWVFSGDKAAAPFVREAKKFKWLEDAIGVKVTHESRYCHSNSMSVEVELIANEMDLVPKEHREEVSHYFREYQDALEEWHNTRGNIERAMMAPIYEWSEMKRVRSQPHRRILGPKGWRPAFNQPRPEPLNLPMPPEPEIQAPAHIKRMIATATKKFKELVSEDTEDSKVTRELREFIEEWVKDTSKELEKIGYAEIEYRDSDESIIETFEGNDYTFDEDGERL